MGDWHDFFLARAGAAGVITGLVFVGVSFYIEKITSQPESGISGRGGGPGLFGGRSYGVLPAARAGAGHEDDRGGGARDRTRCLVVARVQLAAAAEALAGGAACFRRAFLLAKPTNKGSLAPLKPRHKINQPWGRDGPEAATSAKRKERLEPAPIG